MLSHALASDPLSPDLKQEVTGRSCYYIVARPETTEEEWQKRSFAAYIDEKDALVVFMDQEEAQTFATMSGICCGSQPMVNRVAREQFLKLLAEYEDSSLIYTVKFYSRPPLCVELPVESLTGGREQEAPQEPQEPIVEGPAEQKEWKGVDRVRAVLETYDSNKRRVMDKGALYENIHTLVRTLIQQNGIDASDLDRELDLAPNYTSSFCSSSERNNVPMSIIMKYLRYFGLQHYLFIYRLQSTEMVNFLKAHNQIDVMQLKKPTVGSERFVVKDMRRAIEPKTDAYVYSVKLENAARSVDVIISNPLGIVVGREYQVVGLPPLPGAQQTAASKLPMMSDEMIQKLAEELAGSEKQKAEKEPRSYADQRKDAIIGYFRKRNMNTRDAEARYKTLEMEPDILDEFYKYIETKQFGKLEVAGYTARKLIQKLSFEPYEAFLHLVLLRTDPQNTKQKLIYRERDPQYQKQPPKTGKQ